MSPTEYDQLLDHEYDGIREYDNPLPGWWVAIFWATFFFSIVYVAYYHIGVGPSVLDQHSNAALAFFEKQAELYKDLEVTDEVILGFQANEALMVGTAGLFVSKCATCHQADGGGNIGPNLTDDFWLHGGSPKDIYDTVSHGVPAKGMQAWDKLLNPVQIMYLAAYVRSLQGTTPAQPKPQQGTKFIYTPPPPTTTPPAEEPAKAEGD